MDDAKLIEALIDLQVEIQAIRLALVEVNIPQETIDHLKSEIDRREVRKLILGLSGQQSAPGASQ
jgi:hypothetical protein